MKITRAQAQENPNRSASISSYRWDAFSDVNHTMPGENFKPAAAQYEAIIASMRAEISQLKKQQSQRLLYITNASSEGIWEWNIGTGHIYRNMTLQSMIGFAVENTQDLSWWFERVHPEDKKQIEAQINSVLNQKRQSWELEYRFLCADNTYKAVYDRGIIIYENNQPIRMIGTLQDLTEMKELEGRLSQERKDRQKKIAEAILQAEERERTNLGHELHDNVNQVLTTARLYLDMVTPSDAKGADIVEKTKAFIHNAINEIRCISREMVLPNLKDQPLAENIRELLEDLKATGLYEISFVHEEDKPVMLPEEKKIALFRVIQEQLKNIIKHSGACRIDVRLRTHEGQLTLSVKDDGIGFDSRKKAKGIGLANIRDRIQLCKGRVKLDTAPGKGCLLEVQMPV